MIDALLILTGLILLYFGGEGLVRGTVSLASGLGLSKLLVSAVVIGFGTSMPEMTVSLEAALLGSPDIAVGNVIGSNIANILLIVGVSSVISPIATRGMLVNREIWVMLAAGLGFSVLCLIGTINFFSGLILFLALIIYVFWTYKQDKIQQAEKAQSNRKDPVSQFKLNMPKSMIYSIVGLILLISGAYILVEGAVSLARTFAISEAVIGLTVVAIGTSIPELATSIVAGYHKHNDVIIGNVLGTNIFNIFFILGVISMVSPIPIGEQIARYDIWFMLCVFISFGIYLLLKLPLNRLIGSFMLLIYGLYITWLYTMGSVL